MHLLSAQSQTAVCCVLQVLIDDLQLHGLLSAQEFLQQREEILDRLFPSSPLMPGEAARYECLTAAAAAALVIITSIIIIIISSSSSSSSMLPVKPKHCAMIIAVCDAGRCCLQVLSG
jgi:hypothetical protein